jgi:hypothetical protein
MDYISKHRVFSKLFPIPNRWKNVLYIHIPFCLQRCRFCIYFSKVPEGRSEIVNFVNNELGRQIDDYAEILATTLFSELYIGGGTPTIIPPTVLDSALASIPGLDGIAMKAIEASPRTIRREHVDVLAAHRFRYVSIGLQTFNAELLRRENRETADLAALASVIDGLQARGIIVNLDLIAFLATGSMADLAQADSDLRRTIDELAPASITLHSNYNAAKTPEKQLALIRLVRAACERSPAYSCTNSLLLDEDAAEDARCAAEYRLMRQDVRDFGFYLLAKVPQALRFGYNVLALGDYDLFKLRSNFFGVSDFYPPHAQAGVLAAARETEWRLSEVRHSLGLAHAPLSELDEFFTDARGRAAYMTALQTEGFPTPTW